nr:PREDICTED: piggyBac transposable element-derived protein 4-like [Megachile rotundata]
METNEAEILSEVFDDNLSDVPSGNEDADDSFEDCEDDSSDSEIIRPVKKSKVAVFSSDFDTDEEMIILCSYHDQTAMKRKTSSRTLKWSSVTPKDMKKFLGLIILMGQTRKDSWKDYWSTAPLVFTPIFAQTMSRHRFEQIWTFWHFNDNTKMDSRSGRLFKIQPVLDYFLHKFRTIYKPKQQLSLDEGMIPWRGRLRFRTYNPVKLTKHGLLVRMVCESDTGYICNMDIYTAEGRKLEQTILKVE